MVDSRFSPCGFKSYLLEIDVFYFFVNSACVIGPLCGTHEWPTSCVNREDTQRNPSDVGNNFPKKHNGNVNQLRFTVV